MATVAAVLFDLDDTLFDHRHCARAALERVHGGVPCFAATPFADFEASHAALLEEIHLQVLAGRLGIDDARRERFRRLFEHSGAAPSDGDVEAVAVQYRQAYLESRRPVAGAAALICGARALAKVGIVSNNLLDEQRDKLRHCGLDECVDALVVSEEVGVSKPDPRIFRVALERLGCDARAAVMIGDSWEADVRGALAAGIRAIWYNPRRALPPDPEAPVPQLHALEPIGEVLGMIFREPALPRPGESRAGG